MYILYNIVLYANQMQTSILRCVNNISYFNKLYVPPTINPAIYHFIHYILKYSYIVYIIIYYTWMLYNTHSLSHYTFGPNYG